MGLLMTNLATQQGNRTFDCGGAQIRAHCRHLATVVTIRGEIDDVNVDWVSKYIRRFFVGSNPVVIDMSDMRQFAVSGLSLLDAIDEDCRAAGVEWTLIASPAVTEVLDASGNQDANGTVFPIAPSVHEALHNLADAIVNRRQLVLPLIKKSA
jgi:anti-anti-sigma factor